LQLADRHRTPEIIGMAKNFQPVRDATFDETAFQHLAEQAEQTGATQGEQLHRIHRTKMG
jgi:hypothetical protein